MGKQQVTKKQHYISQGLLRLFSNDGKHIFECMVPQYNVYRAKIADAMEENYTYEHPLLEENTLENTFATRAIGLKETMILLPLSSSLYIALFNGNVPYYIKPNQICSLTESEVFQINKIIFHNSFKKCAGPSLELLDSLQKEKYSSYAVNQVFFGKDSGGVGGYTNKKEIFLYPEDEDICTYHIQYALKYEIFKVQV